MRRSLIIKITAFIIVAVTVVGIVQQRKATQRNIENMQYLYAMQTWPPGVFLNWMPTKTKIQQGTRLLVGDSMAYWWPWEGDVVGLSGRNTSEIRAAMPQLLATHRYEYIVLWPGTAHFMDGGSVTKYVSDTQAMLSIARQQSDNVILIAPLPIAAFPSLNLPVGSARAKGYKAFQQICAIHDESITCVDLTEWYDTTTTGGVMRERYTQPDGVHLNKVGYAAVRRELATRGVEIEGGVYGKR